MDVRREYPLALAGLAGGGALALVATQATWVVATTRDVGYQTAFHGSDVASSVVACGLVAMAGSVAVLATRGLGRRLVGAVLAVAGAVMTVVALGVVVAPGSAVRHPLSVVTGGGAAPPDVVSLAWWWCVLAAAGGLAVLVAGSLTASHGRRWPAMAARYDAPSGQRRAAAPDAWALLDRGEDPTVDPGTAAGRPDLQQ